MTGIYYVELADVLAGAGVAVAVTDVNAGWERRARSSGGFASPPLAVCWHHTASSTSPGSDLSWMIHGSDDAPIGNMLLDRDGVVWPIAAGAANTQGKGGPATFSRGTVPVDQGNSRIWGIEVANSGLGETWPLAQVDAYFAASNALSVVMFGNRPDDVITHGGPDGWAPDRKIDPATAAAVTGTWRPAAVTSSGTWSLDDIRGECARRATTTTPPPEEPDMTDEQAAQLATIAAQLDELHSYHVDPLAGNLDPNGDEINSAWTAVYAYRIAQDCQRRMWAIEDALGIAHT
jgi:hypothetical protein